jgi:hypothetical protein
MRLKNKMKFVSLYNILRCCVYVSCGFLFLILMIDVWEKFDKKITTIGSKFRTETSELLPCMTFCPLPGFKSKGFFFTNQSYIEVTQVSISPIFRAALAPIFFLQKITKPNCD